MENQTRYDLNAAVENWRNELAAQPNLASDDRRELETHLRDAIAGFQQRGLNDEESLWLAREKIGQLRLIGKEFKKVGAIYWNRPMALTALGIFVVSLFLPAYAAIGMWPGYKCALAILPWHMDWNGLSSSGNVLDWLSVANWQLLNFANLLMIASPILLCWFGQNARMMRWFHRLTLAAVILVGWFYLDEFIHNYGHDCGLGCYVWILSFVLLYLSVLQKFVLKQNQKTPKRA
jgi:hypothetical protein